jgi:hypothetical protein
MMSVVGNAHPAQTTPKAVALCHHGSDVDKPKKEAAERPPLFFVDF